MKQLEQSGEPSVHVGTTLEQLLASVNEDNDEDHSPEKTPSGPV